MRRKRRSKGRDQNSIKPLYPISHFLEILRREEQVKRHHEDIVNKLLNKENPIRRNSSSNKLQGKERDGEGNLDSSALVNI